VQSDLPKPQAVAALPEEKPKDGDVLVTKGGTLYRFFKTGVRRIYEEDLNPAEADQVASMRKLLDHAARRRASR
jgi:hypothetical protein